MERVVEEPVVSSSFSTPRRPSNGTLAHRTEVDDTFGGSESSGGFMGLRIVYTFQCRFDVELRHTVCAGKRAVTRMSAHVNNDGHRLVSALESLLYMYARQRMRPLTRHAS